jgi:Mg2+ and Co2+ transporter CorA
MAENDMSKEINDRLLRVATDMATLIERSNHTEKRLEGIENRLAMVELKMDSITKEMGKYSVIAAVVIAGIVFIVQQALRVAGG